MTSRRVFLRLMQLEWIGNVVIDVRLVHTEPHAATAEEAARETEPIPRQIRGRAVDAE